MTNLINVSYSTVLVATDARLSIIALSDQSKTTGDTPEALTDLLNQLASLETVGDNDTPNSLSPTYCVKWRWIFFTDAQGDG
ncbi:hypothetical protein N7467_001902 [Penicillium canescens]|nr:hypothetical protein N7467_001902 [Penicillium canescens]